MSTEISPRATLKVRSGNADHHAEAALYIGAGGAAVERREGIAHGAAAGAAGLPREEDVDLLEFDGCAHRGFLLLFRPADAIQDDGEQHDGEARLEAHAHLHRVERAHHRHAESAGADQRRDHHHREAEHDALGDAGDDGAGGARQLDLPQKLQRRRAEGLAGLDEGLAAPRRSRDA